MEGQKALHFRNAWGCRERGWGGVGVGVGSGGGGGGGGHSDVNSMSDMKKLLTFLQHIYSIFDDFAMVRHIPPLPSSS